MSPTDSSHPPRRALGRGPGAARPAPDGTGLGEPVSAAPVPAVPGGPGTAVADRDHVPDPVRNPERAPDPVRDADTPSGTDPVAGETEVADPARDARRDEGPAAPDPAPSAPAAAEPAAADPVTAGHGSTGHGEGPEPSGSREGDADPGPEPELKPPATRAASTPEIRDPGQEGDVPGGDGRFTVRLVNFEGPFDLLLQLISKHKLDVTEVALSKVTDEFMAYIRGMGEDWDLDQTTEFLVVAATLLDLKAARLLPAAEVEDEADLALLEARDLLFARLLQYRAYKQIAEIFSGRLEEEGRRYPRTVGLEPHHAELLPEVVISIGAEGFARLAVKAMQPRPRPQVYVDHIHAPLVSVREQAGIVVAMLRERGRVGFRELADDAPDTLTVVARFLALLELYRDKAVALEQEEALGELLVTWTGGDTEATVTDEFDRAPETTEDTA
ncbi:segregation/condensation protein A [Streptomyces sp. NPDC051018]|uniref:segregation and condensation protein A n=1 Tax=Streptomyces sp. NPDC051018 TaxID=3365639 RepID=UPI0037B5828A